MHERSTRARTKRDTVRDRLILKESTIRFHALDISLIGTVFWLLEVEIVDSLHIVYLRGISTLIIECLCDGDTIFFRETKVHIPELWSDMDDTRTICIGREVSRIDMMRLVSSLPVVVLWKWWDIRESDEFSAFQFSDESIFTLSLKYRFCTIFRDDELLTRNI